MKQIGPGREGFNGEDRGHGEFTKVSSDRYRFRTPGLRNVEVTGPYMHDGSIATLDGVIEFYDKGVSENPLAAHCLDSRFHPLGLTSQEKAALKAFLLTLTDDSWYDIAIPPGDVPSGLEVPR